MMRIYIYNIVYNKDLKEVMCQKFDGIFYFLDQYAIIYEEAASDHNFYRDSKW